MRWTFIFVLACPGPMDPDAAGLDSGSAIDAPMFDAGPDSGCNVLDRDGDGHDSVDCGGDDCEDDDPDTYPGNTEICNGGAHDEDCDIETLGERDEDGDTFHSSDCCNMVFNIYDCQDDCDDTNAAIHPGVMEMCDLVDENCDGMVDEGSMRLYYNDFDRDGRGNPDDSLKMCMASDEWVDNADDCNPTCGTCWTDAPELCDGIDNDCDLDTDEGCPPP